MKNINVKDVLKKLRKTSKMSANEVIVHLASYGIDISSKTLYGYESGLSMPNADIFVALCKIYGCQNPLLVLEPKENNPTSTEVDAGHVSIELLVDALSKIGYLAEGEDLSDDDLRFLMSIGTALCSWFEGRNNQ